MPSIDLYRKMYLIRAAEQGIKKYYHEDEMRTPMHMSEGSEAVVSGVCACLKKEDQVFGTYRSHALYLAKTEETDQFFAEMYGKITGVARGKGGSMHMSSPENGYMLSSAIVASSIPLAVGSAFANKYKKNGLVAVSFFGDGATEEGSFWESFNLACVYQVPVVFVCEDNEFAVHTYKNSRQGHHGIVDIMAQWDCDVFESDSTDADDIEEIAAEAVGIAREYNYPVFLSLKYYRYLEHVGINQDFDQGYREKSEFDLWNEKDPLVVYRKKMWKSGIDTAIVTSLEKEIDEQIENSIQFAKNSPYPEKPELYEHVFK